MAAMPDENSTPASAPDRSPLPTGLFSHALVLAVLGALIGTVLGGLLGALVGASRGTLYGGLIAGGIGLVVAGPALLDELRRERAVPPDMCLGLIVVLVVYFALFAVLNLNDVQVDWVFGSGRAPLIIVIVISLLIGIVLTYFVERRSKRKG